MANKTSQHILNTATNLLGFCLFVLTSLHITNKTKNSYVDECASIVAIILIVSCFFSFASIKTNNEIREEKLENIADVLFLISLTGIFFVIVFVVLTYWNA